MLDLALDISNMLDQNGERAAGTVWNALVVSYEVHELAAAHYPLGGHDAEFSQMPTQGVDCTGSLPCPQIAGRCSISMPCCSMLLTGTKRIPGR